MDPRQVAEWVIENTKTRYVNSSGLVSRTYPPSERTLFDNFDDMVPFFLWFGEADFLVDQVAKSADLGYFKLLAEQNLVYSYRIDEYVGGLHTLFAATGDRRVSAALDEAVRLTNECFVRDGDIRGTYDLSTREPCPFVYSRSAGLLETWLEMGETFPEQAALAKQIIDRWLESPFFLRYGLFPVRTSAQFPFGMLNAVAGRVGRYRMHRPQASRVRSAEFLLTTSGYCASLMKSNTTVVFTLISLFRKTGETKYREAVARWLDCAIAAFDHDGVVYGDFYPLQGRRENPHASNSFILVDVIADASAFIPGDWSRPYLRAAKDLLDRAWASAWENGLIPLYPGADRNHIDSNLDLAVAARRFGELTANPVYVNNGRALIETVATLHRADDGFWAGLDRAGRPLNVGKTNAVDPKYNVLFLKGMVSLLTADSEIYKTPKLHDVLKDR